MLVRALGVVGAGLCTIFAIFILLSPYYSTVSPGFPLALPWGIEEALGGKSLRQVLFASNGFVALGPASVLLSPPLQLFRLAVAPRVWPWQIGASALHLLWGIGAALWFLLFGIVSMLAAAPSWGQGLLMAWQGFSFLLAIGLLVRGILGLRRQQAGELASAGAAPATGPQ